MDERKSKVNELTFGLLSLLEQNGVISDVRVANTNSVAYNVLEQWEVTNNCKLPNDLKQFYRTTNGISIQWSAHFSGKLIPVGLIEINSMEALTELTESFSNICINETLFHELIDTTTTNQNRTALPSMLDKTSFILHNDSVYGKVILNIDRHTDPNSGSQIWFMDRSFQFHFLASSFISYLRMLVFHMGIRGWQYSFTKIGLTPDVQKWFNYFLGELNNDDGSPPCIIHEDPLIDISPNAHVNDIDFTNLFKHKNTNKKKNEQTKQKQNPSSTKPNKTRSNPPRSQSRK